MLITITETIPNPPLQFDTDDLFLRGWYSNSFVAGDQITPVEGGDGKTGFYYNIACSRGLSNNLVIPEFVVQATTESNPTATFFGQLYVDGSPQDFIFGTGGAGWSIPTVYGSSVTFYQLAQYNAAITLFYPPPTFLTATQTIALILNLIAQQIIADAITGALSANRIPRAATESTLTDSQIQDNGTNVTIDTLNTVQMGDVNDNQNGSYISINDTEGRVSFQAGGDSNAQYAGISAVAGVDQSEFYIQGSAGNGYNYGAFSDGIAKLGDALEENNGTRIEIDDVNEWIKLHNLPTSDPGELNALWKDGTTIKISAG